MIPNIKALLYLKEYNKREIFPNFRAFMVKWKIPLPFSCIALYCRGNRKRTDTLYLHKIQHMKMLYFNVCHLVYTLSISTIPPFKKAMLCIVWKAIMNHIIFDTLWLFVFNRAKQWNGYLFVFSPLPAQCFVTAKAIEAVSM